MLLPKAATYAKLLIHFFPDNSYLDQRVGLFLPTQSKQSFQETEVSLLSFYVIGWPKWASVQRNQVLT